MTSTTSWPPPEAADLNVLEDNTVRTLTKTLVAVTASAALVATGTACSSSGGGDKKPVATIAKITGGTTSVALDPAFLSAVTQTLKLTPGVVAPSTLVGSTVSFPITGGHVTVYKKGKVTPYVQGTVTHSGGLTLKGGATTVTLQNFVVDPGNNSKLTGEVLANGAVAVKSAKLFDLDGSTLKTPSVSSAGVATLTGTKVLLSSDAAALLNKTFKTTAVKAGTLVGIATIKANSK